MEPTAKNPDPHHIFIDEVQGHQRRWLKVIQFTSSSTKAAAIMLAAAIVALVIANSPFFEPFEEFWHTHVVVGVGGFIGEMSLAHIINDIFMAVFFLLVGLEIKYEMTVGELTNIRQAALPIIAACGGVLAPIVIYSIFNATNPETSHGWGVPTATDIAFALGIMALLGNRVPNGVRVFFSTLAIADDLISIAAIAIFYGQSPNPFWLGAAALVTCALVWLNKTQHYRLAPYSVLGLLLWFCMFKSGVHATLAGVILAFTIPAKCGVKLDSLTDWLGECLPLLDDRYDDEAHILGQHDFTVSTTKVERVMHRVTPPLIRMERLISTPVNFVILPIFAFVNAQVRLVGVDMSTLLTDPVTLGVYFGMLLGKPIGIFGMTFALVKLKACELPRNVNWHMIAGVGILGGIGFTMSILISGLAFPTAQFEVLAAKAAILAGSVTAAVLGMIYMSVICKHPAPKNE